MRRVFPSKVAGGCIDEREILAGLELSQGLLKRRCAQPSNEPHYALVRGGRNGKPAGIASGIGLGMGQANFDELSGLPGNLAARLKHKFPYRAGELAFMNKAKEGQGHIIGLATGPAAGVLHYVAGQIDHLEMHGYFTWLGAGFV